MASFHRPTGEAAEPSGPRQITDDEVLRVRDMLMVRLGVDGWPQGKIALLFNRDRTLVNKVVNAIPPGAVADIRGLWE